MSDPTDAASWIQRWEEQRADLLRAEKLQNQFAAVLQPLQQKCDALEAENAQLLVGVGLDEQCSNLESEIEAARATNLALEARQDTLVAELERRQQESNACAARASEDSLALTELTAMCSELSEACDKNETEHEVAVLKARSMVTADILERAAADAVRLQEQLHEQEAETSRLRQALADAWASRVDEGADAGEKEAEQAPGQAEAEQAESDSSSGLQALEAVEEELKWLTKMQQQAQAEVHHLQHLERSEAALQAQLREVSEENAALRSARMDLGDTGHAMREAIAAQSERFVGRVGGLAEERRSTDQDRVKLLQDIAEMQARLDSMGQVVTDLSELEAKHADLEAERSSLTVESERLRIVNAAMGMQLLGDEAMPGPVTDDSSKATAEALVRVVQLQSRLVQREEAQSMEQHKLVERIRTLERDAVQGAGPDEDPVADKAVGGGSRSSKGKAPKARDARGSQLAMAASAGMDKLRGGLGAGLRAAGL